MSLLTKMKGRVGIGLRDPLNGSLSSEERTPTFSDRQADGCSLRISTIGCPRVQVKSGLPYLSPFPFSPQGTCETSAHALEDPGST